MDMISLAASGDTGNFQKIGGSTPSLALPTPSSWLGNILNPGGVTKGQYNQGKMPNVEFDPSGISLAGSGYNPNSSGDLFSGGKGSSSSLIESLGGLGKIGGGLLDAAGLYMQHQAMKDARNYNNRNLAILEEQQGLAKRASDTNFANQQDLARQLA